MWNFGLSFVGAELHDLASYALNPHTAVRTQ